MENDNLILDVKAGDEDAYLDFLDSLPPDNDSSEMTVTASAGSTVVQMMWGRPPS